MRGARMGRPRLLRLASLIACAAALACGVKAPPRPPEKAGPAGSRLPASGAPDASEARGDAGADAPDGGTGRP